MYAVSERFLQYINRSGRRKTVVDLYYNGALLLSDLSVAAGSLSYDRRSPIRSRGSLQLASKAVDWTQLDPWGIEISIRTGVVYPDDTEELVPMGLFRVEDYSFKEGTPIAPQLNFFDRAKLFQDVVGWDADYSGRYANSVVREITDFCVGRFISIDTIQFNIPNYRLPGGSVYSGSDLDSLNNIAAAQGGEVYFDRDGRLTLGIISPITSGMTVADAVYDFSIGINLIEASRSYTRDGAYNAVLVYGASNSRGNKITAYAIDSNPASKSNYDSPFGRRIKTLNLPQITTKAAAQTAAEKELAKTVGLVQNTSFTALLNPALDLGDIVSLFYFDSTLELHQIDSMQFDLKSWSMQCTTRSIQYVE